MCSVFVEGKALETHWICIDRDNNSATVHRDTCPYVRHREGDPDELEWHGPYEDLNLAAESVRLGLRIVRDCRVCNVMP